MTDKRLRPPLAKELDAVLRAAPHLSLPLLPHHIGKVREMRATDPTRLSDEALRCGGAVEVSEIAIPASTPGETLPTLVLRSAKAPGPQPGVCFLHGGGMVMGDNRTGGEIVLAWVEALRLTVVSPAYRLAPEHPHPAPVEDAYAALTWMAANRDALGLDDRPLAIAGMSAGGGLAAGVALMARDRGGPALSDQILIYPMLDDREAFPSSTELRGEGVWDATSNATGWTSLLGDRRGGADVSPYAAPSRATDLTGLPAAYVDVGAVEVFRDEAIDYATRLARSGVSTELHVWAGAFHGFDVLAPESAVAKAAHAARIDYLRRRIAERHAA